MPPWNVLPDVCFELVSFRPPPKREISVLPGSGVAHSSTLTSSQAATHLSMPRSLGGPVQFGKVLWRLPSWCKSSHRDGQTSPLEKEPVSCNDQVGFLLHVHSLRDVPVPIVRSHAERVDPTDPKVKSFITQHGLNDGNEINMPNPASISLYLLVSFVALFQHRLHLF